MARHRNNFPRWYERIPSARDRETVRGYADWVCQVAWQVYATFTFAWPVSDAQANKVFHAYINRLEHLLRARIAFVRGDEKRFSGCGMPASARHYHVLMTGTVPLDAPVESVLLATQWRRFGGSGQDQDSAKVLPCVDPQERAAYCLKFINETEGDWKFGNLEWFMPGVPGRARRAADRQARREAQHRALSAAPRSTLPRSRPGLATGALPNPRLVRRREAAAGASCVDPA